MTETVADPSPSAHVPGLGELFLTFATIAMYGFGGVLAWTRRMVVEERKWMTALEFNETYALAQFLPGPNIVNFSVVFGRRLRGVPGAAVSLTGLLGPPVLLVTFIGMLYAAFGEIAALQRFLAGVSAAAAGLVIATTCKMGAALFRDRRLAPPLVALAGFLAIGVMRWPLPQVLLALVPASLALAWWSGRLRHE